MARRKHPRGTVYLRHGRWCWRFGWGGARYSGTTEARSEAEAHGILMAEIVRITGQRPASEGRTTLGDLLEAWAEHRHRHDIARVRPIVNALGPTRPTDDIEPADVVAWGAKRAEKVKTTTIRRELALLSSMYRWAIPRRMAQRNPCHGAPTPKVERSRKEGLSREGVADLMRQVAGHPLLEPAYRLALYAGLRRSEIAAARWEDVDFERGTVYVRGEKTDKSTATLPLHRDLAAYLKPLRKDAGPIIEGKHGTGIRPDALEVARQRHDAALPGFHLMRHTLATLLIRQGVELGRISRILRHSSTRVTEAFYAHLRPVDCRSDLDSFEL